MEESPDIHGRLVSRLWRRHSSWLSDSANQHIEHRRKKDAENSHSQHSGEHSCAERLSHLGARACSDDERNDPGDESKRSHQDWTQAEFASLDYRRNRIFTLVLDLFGILDDKDGVLTSEADKDDKANLSKYIVVHPSQ